MIDLNNIKTISLFSGAGGKDYGFLQAGFNIIWANDIDKYAVQSYRANIGEHIYEGDIRNFIHEIPQHDVLLAGFPCQPFSMMGQMLGFEDERGTLFFVIQQILEKHNTKVIVLENVKNLLTHDNGHTFTIMKDILKNLGYKIYFKVLNSADYGIPQTRRRVFVVGFKEDNFRNESFNFPEPIPLTLKLQDFLDENIEEKYFLSNKILPTILSHGSGNYYSFSEIDLDIARPLTATMHKMHRANQDNYVTDVNNRSKFKNDKISSVRRLTPNECRKLQGFPENWNQVVSDTQAYRQLGNAVTVKVAYNLAQSVKEYIKLNEVDNG